jgi:monoamine oxidase
VTSALMRLRAAVWRGRTQRWTKIRGGNDQLPKAFATALADRIHYKTPAVRVEHSPERVRVVATRNGTTETVDADYLVCTLPLPVLRHLDVRPAFPARVQRAIREYGYGSTTKIFLQTRSRYWEREGLSGFAVTDRPSQEVWNISATQPGRRGLLIVYISGKPAPQLAGRSEADRVAWAAGEAEYLFPGIREELENGVAYSWDENRWAGAAFAQPRPGQVIEFLTVLRQPVGRIVFAGDHASAWPAWMQGALESGNHAARLIDAAPS